MRITIVAPIFNFYGKFLTDFLVSIINLEIKPERVIISLGKDHGVTDLIKGPTYIFNENVSNVGQLLNFAIDQATTEWIVPMDIDDIILSNAISRWKRHNSDYICSGWLLHWENKILYRQSPLPSEIALMSDREKSKRRINNNSPFKKWLWEREPFQENNFPNLRFLSHCVEQQATFSHEPHPCFEYRQHGGSLCRSELWKKQKPEIRKEAKLMYETFEKYYL